MPRKIFLVTAVILAALLLVQLLKTVHTAADASDSSSLQPLTDLTDHSTWFEQNTGYVHDPAYFGAYAFFPMGDTLYIGFGAGRPADVDGSLLARMDGVTMTAVSTLTEQGFIGMTNLNDNLIIPGVDPCCTDGWEFGNTYVYTPTAGEFTKFRNLPDVVHSWGLWADESKGMLYTAVSFSPAGGDGGGLFSSTTQAESWVTVAISTSGIGLDRTYDVLGLHDKLYVTWSDSDTEPCGLAVSEDGGQTWDRLTGLSTMCRPRLAEFQDKLLALRDDRAALFAIDAAGTAVTHTLPGFHINDWSYNYWATDSSGALHVVSDDGRIMTTRDLITWNTAVTTTLDLITLAYWPAQNWLVVGDRGSNARLWRLELNHKCYLPIVNR